jgi:hypothetical protein
MNRIKRTATILVLVCIIGSAAHGNTQRHRPAAQHRTYSTARSSSARFASHPYYGGGKHTISHGGSYPGSMNPSHKYGHYQSPITGTRTYGSHQFGTAGGTKTRFR